MNKFWYEGIGSEFRNLIAGIKDEGLNEAACLIYKISNDLFTEITQRLHPDIAETRFYIFKKVLNSLKMADTAPTYKKAHAAVHDCLFRLEDMQELYLELLQLSKNLTELRLSRDEFNSRKQEVRDRVHHFLNRSKAALPLE